MSLRSRPAATAAKISGAGERHRMFTLAVELEEPLDQALALTAALELIGTGLNSIGRDHGTAIITVAEAVTAHLTTAKATWRQIMAASTRRPAKRRAARA